MFDAFYNGFPIVYSDSSTYIVSGFGLDMPMDRPLLYGILLRIFSLNGISLWFVTFFQALIVSYLIFLLMELFVGRKEPRYTLFVILFLSLFTGLSWVVSQLMADVFTPIALLCAIIIISKESNQKPNFVLYLIYTLSIGTHISHVLMFSGLLLLTFFIKNLFFQTIDYKKVNYKIFSLLGLTVLTILSMGAPIAKSKHVFFMGAMVEHGITKKFLDENCNNKPYQLCAYKDSFPEKAWQFVWNESSPLYKIGGWKKSEKEFNEIIHETLTQPKYIILHIQESVKATIQQMSLFAIGDGNGSFLEGTLLFERVAKYFPNDLSLYRMSKQSNSNIGFIDTFNPVYNFIIIVSSCLLLFFFVQQKVYENPKQTFICVLIILGVLINAWDCGTFANAIDRLGCKMMWLIPFNFFLILSNKIKKQS